MGLSGTGCDLNHKQRTSTIEIDPTDTEIVRRRVPTAAQRLASRNPERIRRRGVRSDDAGRHLSNGDNLSDPRWHDRARVRTIPCRAKDASTFAPHQIADLVALKSSRICADDSALVSSLSANDIDLEQAG